MKPKIKLKPPSYNRMGIKDFAVRVIKCSKISSLQPAHTVFLVKNSIRFLQTNIPNPSVETTTEHVVLENNNRFFEVVLGIF